MTTVDSTDKHSNINGQKRGYPTIKIKIAYQMRSNKVMGRNGEHRKYSNPTNK